MTKGKPEHRFAYDNLRDWIEEADKLGEMRYLEGLSWEREIGMVTELLHHTDPAPCALFDKVPGSPDGFRVLSNFFGGRRRAMTVGFPEGLTKLELSDGLADVIESKKPIPHEIVASGPVTENVLSGNDIDVTLFPTPRWHEEDGGRYIGTGSYNVTRDPDEGWINTGTYRVMVHDKKTVGFYISPGKHGRIHRDKYAARGERMPAAVVLGGNPMMFLMASSEVPYGLCEYDVVGGYQGKPMPCIQGEVTGLPFPANAEIVLEGWIEPDEASYRDEGPFGEWTGYYASDQRPEPIMKIERIYHRNDPIILGCPPQRPPDELARYRAVARSALLKRSIMAAGVPDVQGVWADEVGTARMFVVVAIKQRYPGHAAQAGHIACQCHVGAYAGKYVIVVDEDIDVSNLEHVMWAVVTRSDPAESIDIVKNAWSTPLDPRISPEQRRRRDFTNSRAIINACRPFYWKDQFPLVNQPSPELARETRERFSWVLDPPQPKGKEQEKEPSSFSGPGQLRESCFGSNKQQ